MRSHEPYEANSITEVKLNQGRIPVPCHVEASSVVADDARVSVSRLDSCRELLSAAAATAYHHLSGCPTVHRFAFRIASVTALALTRAPARAILTVVTVSARAVTVETSNQGSATRQGRGPATVKPLPNPASGLNSVPVQHDSVMSARNSVIFSPLPPVKTLQIAWRESGANRRFWNCPPQTRSW